MNNSHKILNGDVFSSLCKIKDNTIDFAVTSPPYWGQRDYGFEGQIGNEKNYMEYISRLIFIFHKLRKKLKKDGVFFLNVGDKYISKYGKSPLAFVPYKLAYFMVMDGWMLNDILIWYKPNHMPSSIKNRFTNSHEPIFVFSKNDNNIFTKFKNNNMEYSNVLKVNLQPTPYKHVATYPEKLIEKLINMTDIPNNGIVLDPFAGSGTTLKVTQRTKNLSGIMIEMGEEYIKIIQERCFISSNNIEKIDFTPYKFPMIEEKKNFSDNSKDTIDIKSKGFLKITETKEDYYNLLGKFFNNDLKNFLNPTSVCLIGTKEFDIELIFRTSLLNNNGWVIRNLLVVEQDKKWFPVFMVVDDNKRVNYNFDYKKLNLKHKNNNNIDWSKVNFIGYEVKDSISKNKRKGYLIKILEKYANCFPKYVIVKWEDGIFTKEFVIYSEDEINRNLEFINGHDSTLPVLKEKLSFIELNKNIQINDFQINIIDKEKNNLYNGKFNNEIRKNWGASPGARASMESDYFSLQRLYNVEQNLVCDYLNKQRIEKKLTKNGLTNLFPKEYKHTVGHWLRKDFGGSIPVPEDWKTLTKILNIDNSYTNYVCKTGLKLQTVKQGEHKLPDDFVPLKNLNKFSMLF
ncbi:MAG: site-specific DNA-methyltransferase [Leptospiraceae bacterium]|nr:site-specific DNA-methyltransferase [Leptospiraceae bacterium]MCP5493092.1 site-specific DNA-methyltransferase [Leptospiraceae bacterium]